MYVCVCVCVGERVPGIDSYVLCQACVERAVQCSAVQRSAVTACRTSCGWDGFVPWRCLAMVMYVCMYVHMYHGLCVRLCIHLTN